MTLREYEALLILPAKLDDEAVKKTMQAVSDEITTLGGSVTNYDVVGKKVFVRQLKKQNAGIYIKMHFELDSEAVKALLARLKFNADVFRIQVTSFDPVVAAAKAANAEKALVTEDVVEVAETQVTPEPEKAVAE
jgi:ribosomal protein S6